MFEKLDVCEILHRKTVERNAFCLPKCCPGALGVTCLYPPQNGGYNTYMGIITAINWLILILVNLIIFYK